MTKAQVAFRLAALLLVPTAAQAYGWNFWYYRSKLPLNSQATCKSKKTVEVDRTVFSKSRYETCVDHTTFIATSAGGRAQFLTSGVGEGLRPHYGSFALEVNCQTMEKRHRNLWGFTTRDMSTAPGWVGWQRDGSVWFHNKTSYWGDWEPIEQVSNDQKWICGKFKNPGLRPEEVLADR